MILRRNGKNRTNGRNVLMAIAILFVASGVIRFGAGPGQAIARELVSADKTPIAEPTQCQTGPEIETILSALLKREEAVTEKERELDEKQQTLAFAETEIRKNLSALEQVENELSATIAKSRTASEDDLKRLTLVYENMKPKDASVLFEEMAPDFAAGFFARMRPDAAAEIMTGLDPSTAYSISVILAGRNANTPTE